MAGFAVLLFSAPSPSMSLVSSGCLVLMALTVSRLDTRARITRGDWQPQSFPQFHVSQGCRSLHTAALLSVQWVTEGRDFSWEADPGMCAGDPEQLCCVRSLDLSTGEAALTAPAAPHILFSALTFACLSPALPSGSSWPQSQQLQQG